jgi:endogenous inhibitor of DNA gyrase (YacG/DUF329 family)
MQNVVRCPACGTPQLALRIMDGKLFVGDVQVIGYVCPKCGKVVHFGHRGDKRKHA